MKAIAVATLILAGCYDHPPTTYDPIVFGHAPDADLTPTRRTCGELPQRPAWTVSINVATALASVDEAEMFAHLQWTEEIEAWSACMAAR